MKTLNVEWFPCSPAAAFRLASQVQRWPSVLPHYRWVRFHQGSAELGGVVEMAAWRQFGAVAWPVWWVSEMRTDPDRLQIAYEHIRGITRGMEVLWEIEPSGSGSRVTIHHEWEGGPRFCGPAAKLVGRTVVGPHFVHSVASRTLEHLRRQAAREVAI